MHWNVTLSKEEFEQAKRGKFVIRGAFLKGKNLGVLILGNRDLSEEEKKRRFYGILASGDDVYYVNISEWDWEQLDKPELDRTPYIEFEDGIGFLFISEDAYYRLKEEPEG